MALRSTLFRGDPKLEAAAVSDPAHIVPGAKGEHVRKIQLALIQLDGATIGADGSYGPSTAAAVLNYKRKRNVINRAYQTNADNIVGKMTMASLDSEMLEQENPTPPGFTISDFRKLCDYAELLLRQELRASPGAIEQGVAFFNQRRLRIESIAFPAAGRVSGFAVPPAGGPVIGAIGLAAVVVVALVLIAFVFACAIVMEAQRNANPADINRLIIAFGRAMATLEAELIAAGIDAVVLVALAMSAVERAVRERIADLRKKMEECRLRHPAKIAECMEKATRVQVQMNHLIQQAIFTSFNDPKRIGPQLVGIANSFGFLMRLISDWARCMGCQLMIFF